MNRNLALFVFVFLLTFVLCASSFGQADDTYQAQCASCHAANGSGDTPAGKKLRVLDLRSKSVQSMSDEELFNSIAIGVKHKEYPHAFARRGMSKEQIDDLVALIRRMPEHKIAAVKAK